VIILRIFFFFFDQPSLTDVHIFTKPLLNTPPPTKYTTTINKTNKQTNKQNKQTNKQTNKQINKQTNKQTLLYICPILVRGGQF